MTAFDASTNEVVGVVALTPCDLVNSILPSSDADSELHQWVCDVTANNAAKSPAGLVMPFYVLDPNHEEAVLLSILRYAFTASPSLRSVILVAETVLPLSQPFLLSYFIDTGKRGPDGQSAYCTGRDAICPVLSVRPAVVEDTDDLVPIVDGARDKFGSLAKVHTPCKILEV